MAALLPLTACSAEKTIALTECQAFDGASLAASACTRVIEADMDTAVGLAPLNATILANRGAVHSQQNNLDAGWRDLEAALRIDPANVLAIGNRAIVLEKRGEFRPARAEIDRAMKIDPAPHQLWSERCWIGAVLADELPRTIKECDHAIELAPNDPNKFNSRGLVHFRMGNYSLAIADYDRSIQGNAGVPSSYLMRGLAKRASGQGADAQPDLDKALQMDPGVAARYAGYGIVGAKQ